MDPNQPTTGQPTAQPGQVSTDQPVQTPQPAPVTETPVVTPEPQAVPEPAPAAPAAEEPKPEMGGGVPPTVPPTSAPQV